MLRGTHCSHDKKERSISDSQKFPWNLNLTTILEDKRHFIVLKCNVQICKCAKCDVQIVMWKSANVQNVMCKSRNVQNVMCKCANVQNVMWKSANVQNVMCNDEE